MISFREFVHTFRDVGLNPGQPVIVHASLAAVGEIRGGVQTVLGALLSMSEGVMAPTFTYKPMIIPEVGPENNACDYGSGKDKNRLAEFYQPDMPADPLMGLLPEAIRKYPGARRSNHPILSFSGIHVDEALKAQTLQEPMAPIEVLTRQNGIVLLIGVNHTVNTSIHYAEYLAGRKQFTRWALTPQGVRECPGFGGCSDGFEQAAPYLAPFTCTGQIGNATVQAIQLNPMIQTLTELLKKQPMALLCSKADERCESVRQSLHAPLVLETRESTGDPTVQ
jgi:aminoglycoside 3-N-acetyltransferase